MRGLTRSGTNGYIIEARQFSLGEMGDGVYLRDRIALFFLIFFCLNLYCLLSLEYFFILLLSISN